MIPPFDDNGYLPPGIHTATMAEIAARFGETSQLRRVQMESLRWLADLAWRAGVQRIIVNGSFVTDRIEPNDVDCALLVGEDYPHDRKSDEELAAGLPFIDLHIVEQEDFDFFATKLFTSDRDLVPKGMIEIVRS